MLDFYGRIASTQGLVRESVGNPLWRLVPDFLIPIINLEDCNPNESSVDLGTPQLDEGGGRSPSPLHVDGDGDEEFNLEDCSTTQKSHLLTTGHLCWTRGTVRAHPHCMVLETERDLCLV
ncbi:hypothetical protein AALO_G00029400 [Alosa alosa]|uniref:Uncharacterized protein n=1 Tax=Alosa alosa TaxID=278164 RepID=A0AAV6HBL3_9TELE|nr:hypothetical protein AALO_G00029400 [Alosa alosa]